MIKLYGFGGSFGLIDPSPFVVKVDAYLRMSGLQHTLKGNAANLRKAPKGKLPYIDDEGSIVADSDFIIAYLKEKYGDVLDADLSAEQKAQALLMSKSLDENFYWCIVYSRWIREDSWPVVRDAFFGKMPFPLNKIIPVIARKGVKDAMQKHGMGRHSDEEIQKICRNTLQALSDLLGDKEWFFGDKPSSLDVSVFAFAGSLVLMELDNPFNQMAREFDNLVAFCTRVHETYYPEIM